MKDSPDIISLWQTPQLNEQEHAPPPPDEETIKALRQQAYAEGFETGRQEALRRVGDDLQAQLTALEACVQALEQPFAELNQQVCDELAMLAVKIAKSLVRRELRTEPETIVALVRDTVSALSPSARRIEIHLNPEDARVFREVTRISGQDKSWEPVEDPLIARGDCKVRSGDSLIDGNLQARLNGIVTQFLGDERHEKSS